QAVEYTTAHPLSSVVNTPIKDCGKFTELPVPMLAWLGDMPTIAANGYTETTSPGSIFAKEGLSVRLYRQDSLVKQLEDYISCKTPFLRVTNGMMVMAGDVFKSDVQGRLTPTPIYLLTISKGGDVAVGRASIKNPKDMCNTDGSLQVYSPHVDYMATIFRSVGCPIPVDKIHWVKDMIEDTKDSMYPARALREDPNIQWVFVISPDAADLTNGQGGEGSVDGARVILSTHHCDTCIADLYYVRSDWAASNKETYVKFVHALMLAQEHSADLMASKQPKEMYEKWITISAKMLLGSADLATNAEAMWADGHFAGWNGNVQFFTDSNYPRNFANMTREASEAFGPDGLRLIAKPVSLVPAALDYTRLKEGLKKTTFEGPKFDRQAVQEVIRKREEQGTLVDDRLFSFDVPFRPNETIFDPNAYTDKLDQMITFMTTMGGAIYTIEAYADTQQYIRLKCGTVVDATGVKKLDMNCKSGTGTPAMLAKIKQTAKDGTLARAIAVRDALAARAGQKGINLNMDKVEVIGHGLMKPNIPGCKYDKEGDVTPSCYPSSKEQWDAMRHAEFSVISTESSDFVALR
ncbi:MAG: hypothetical protein AAB972_01955, partial [Patescibacteria group bacterium]